MQAPAKFNPCVHLAGGVPAGQPRHVEVRLMTSFTLGLSIVLLLLSLWSAPALAQVGKASSPASPASAAASAKPAQPAKAAVVSKPLWADLTAMQQESLRPLAGSWSGLSDAHKRKWLELSKNYPSLSAEDRSTLHSRMNEWVALSPQQRAEARLNFAKTNELSKQLTPEEKTEKWQTYQALSAEEKQKLAAKAPPRPAGAAPAIKPVAPQKLAVVPLNQGKPSDKISAKPSVAASTPAGNGSQPHAPAPKY